ncbi:MAG: elongation factor G [Dissulfurimicrobium sp.]|uniref:elongation factor G n=1 Tax=Dissulfurimicrobium sp. TaxID=2022436 RepID=UPI00404B3EFC
MENENIRNITIAGNNGSGKTSLAEAMLLTAKATKHLGRVDDGSSNLDFEPEEIKHHISISTAFHNLTWKQTRIYISDTPGEDNFLAETMMALRATDNTLYVMDAVDPIKPQTEKTWSMIKEFNLPVIIFINKMDKERADFKKTIDAIKSLGVKPVPLFIPIGAQDDFKGIVDLIQMKAFTFSADGGKKMNQINIPPELKDETNALRGNLIEYAAESEDILLEKFLEGVELTTEEIMSGLMKGVNAGGFAPVVCGSAIKNMAISNLLDLIVQLLSNPQMRGDIKGFNPKTKSEIQIKPLSDSPVSGIVFKTLIDPYAGRLSIMRVYSGTIRPDGVLYNSTRDVDERYSQIYLIEGKSQRPVNQAFPGDIIGLAKLKETATGDTLSSRTNPVVYPFVKIPGPVLTYALKPKTRDDEEKIVQALSRLKEEDPTLVFQRDQQTGELLISGNGQIHIDITVEKMERKFGVQVDLALPQIPYRETIKIAQKGVIYRHKKQTGGAGQFAEVHFDITPLPRGTGFEFEEALVGMNVPRNFVPAVEKGLHEALQAGPLAGFPVVDIKVRFYDGKSHEVDSSEIAFKIAAIQCFKKGVMNAKPTILEPIVKMTINIPDDAVGDVIGDLNSRRGKVISMEPGQNGRQMVIALVPMAEVQRYVLDLNTMTAGRGTFNIEMSHYEEVPGNLADKLITKINEEKAKREK